MSCLLRRAMGLLSIFCDAQRGNAAIVFALSLIPLIGITGAAIDYTRGNSAKTDMQAALDATALMLARDSSVPGKTQTQLNG
jgi:Flp pilus assembly protein TadG